MTNDEILKKLDSFRVYARKGERAPHKALLLLLALGKIHQPGQDRLLPYQEWAQPLTELLNKYGHPGRERYQSPEHPYSRLCQTDNLWEIPNYNTLQRGKNNMPLLAALKKTTGGLPEQLYNAFRQQPELLAAAANQLLRKTFAESIHSEVLESVGLKNIKLTPRLARDSQFRIAVLRAYQECCAVCNYRIRVDGDLVGLEAAHIRWHAYDGPDEVFNGLALCPMHHSALDSGIISLRNDYTILVSSRLHDTMGDQYIKSFADKPIAVPEQCAEHPKREYLEWHRDEVWRG